MATSGLRGYLDTQKSEFLREVRGGGGLPDCTALHCCVGGCEAAVVVAAVCQTALHCSAVCQTALHCSAVCVCVVCVCVRV
eukprot:COSAG02_NODE_24987_length_671_cov_28.681818_1_plen_80_part_10